MDSNRRPPVPPFRGFLGYMGADCGVTVDLTSPEGITEGRAQRCNDPPFRGGADLLIPWLPVVGLPDLAQHRVYLGRLQVGQAHPAKVRYQVVVQVATV